MPIGQPGINVLTFASRKVVQTQCNRPEVDSTVPLTAAAANIVASLDAGIDSLSADLGPQTGVRRVPGCARWLW
jgi:hypothetical protein